MASTRQSMAVRPGEILEIRLRGNSASTGYSWEWMNAPLSGRPGPVRLLENTIEPDPIALNDQGHAMCGSGDTHIFRFEVLQPGRFQLAFGHRRPWDSIDMTRMHVVEVEVVAGRAAPDRGLG